MQVAKMRFSMRSVNRADICPPELERVRVRVRVRDRARVRARDRVRDRASANGAAPPRTHFG